MKPIYGLLFILFCSFSQAFAFKPDFSPFISGEEPPSCGLHVIALTSQAIADDPFSPRTYETLDNGEIITIGVSSQSGQAYVADLTVAGNRVVSPFETSGNSFTFGGVYWADFNNDDRKDFIIMTGFDGVGLAASSGMMSFILSTPSGYTVIQAETWEPALSDLVMLDGDCRYVHTSFVESVVSKDGREHNYWLYTLFSFTPDGLVQDNQRDGRFPKWVMYTWDANHVETSYLTKNQKRSYEAVVELQSD
jgi:hypothetical protein